MKILDLEQGTTEWLQARLGCPSGSGFSKIITSSGTPSSSAETYINQLIAECITGESTFVQKTEWMERGNELEPIARMNYELETDNEVTEVGFCMHDTLKCGVSPDGLVGDALSIYGKEHFRQSIRLKSWAAYGLHSANGGTSCRTIRKCRTC